VRSQLFELRLRHRKDARANFARDGFIVVPSVVCPEEVAGLRHSCDRLVAAVLARHDPDAHVAPSPRTGRERFSYLSHVLEKSTMMRLLLGHPRLANIVTLFLGSSYLSTSEFLVSKEADDAWHVSWHRDIRRSSQVPTPGSVILVGIPLDTMDESNGVYVIPGSQRWTNERARARREHDGDGFTTDDAIPIGAQPGDVVVSDVLLMHGSPNRPNARARRTVYFIFRPTALVRARGPHRPDYVDRKLEIMQACHAERHGLSFVRPPTYRLTSREYYRDSSASYDARRAAEEIMT
jgi:phytanoyl-CoA hydroxylase